MKNSYKVIVLDDNEIILQGLKYILDSNIINFEVFCFEKPDDNFWKLTNETNIDLFIIDICLGAENGRNIVDKIIKDKRGSAFLFISGYDYSLESLSKFAGKCVFDFMTKPIDKDIFMNRVVILLNSVEPLIQSPSQKGPYDSLRKHYRKLLERDKIMIQNFQDNMDRELTYLSQGFKI